MVTADSQYTQAYMEEANPDVEALWEGALAALRDHNPHATLPETWQGATVLVRDGEDNSPAEL